MTRIVGGTGRSATIEGFLRSVGRATFSAMLKLSKSVRNYGGRYRSRLGFAIVMVLFTSAAPAVPEVFQQIECEREGSSLEALSEYVDCLERQIAELLDLHNALLQAQRNIYTETDERFSRVELAIRGPEKVVETFPAVPGAVTIGYWANGQMSETFACVPELEDREGFTIFGGTLSAEQRFNPLRPVVNLCHRPGFCDSAGEFCNYRNRARGCYVNTEWYDWYTEKARRHSLPINYNTICATL